MLRKPQQHQVSEARSRWVMVEQNILCALACPVSAILNNIYVLQIKRKTIYHGEYTLQRNENKNFKLL